MPLLTASHTPIEGPGLYKVVTVLVDLFIDFVTGFVGQTMDKYRRGYVQDCLPANTTIYQTQLS